MSRSITRYSAGETPAEKAKRIGVPLLEPKPRPQPAGNPVVAVCGLCGLELRRVMGLACQNARCPISPRVTL